MEIANKFDVEGYKFYVDESNGDLMITLNNILIGSYSKSGNKWLLDHVHDDKYYSKTEIDTKINELETILQNHYQVIKILCEKHDMIE